MQFLAFRSHKLKLILLLVLLNFSVNVKAEIYTPVVNADDTSKVKTDSLNNELPGPVFYTGINFNKFKFKIKRFITIPEYSFDDAVITKKQNYFEPYYEGQAFSSGMNNFVYINEGYKISKINKDEYVSFNHSGKTVYYPKNQIIKLPKHIVNYLDDYKTDDKGRVILDNITEKQLKKILKPFYFSKFEVSISEYKEFTEWVRKTNGYNDLPYEIKQIKNFDKNTNDTIWKNKLIWKMPKEKAYSYKFYNNNEEIVNQFGKNPSICVAPSDTIELFFNNKNTAYSFFDVNTFYKQGEKFSKYPIVGVSYYQALAFLDWKQHFHQKYLDKNNANIEVKYELPNLIDYDLVLSNIGYNDDCNYLCDLQLSKQSNQRTSLDKLLNARILYSNYKPEEKHFFENSVFEVDLASNNIHYVKKKQCFPENKHILPNGIENLDANVSEWFADTYKDNWLPAYNIHKQTQNQTEAGKLTLAIEEYYNRQNYKNGHLVMGGNFIDYRESIVYNKKTHCEYNKAGLNLKKFVNPKAQYSTIGFRYVVRVVVKNEPKKDSLLRMVGTYYYNKYADFPIKYNKYFSKYVKENVNVNKDPLDKWRFDIKKKKGILVSKTEITNGMWRRFILDYINRGNLDTALLFLPKDSLWIEHNDLYRYYFKDLQFDDYPVVNISHNAVKEFSKWVNRRINFGEQVSEFYLVDEKTWEDFANSGNKDTSYAYSIKNIKEFRYQNLANIKTALTDTIYNYVLKNLYKYTNSDSLILKYKQLPEAMSKAIYRGTYADNMRYGKFLEQEFVFKKYPSLMPAMENNLKNKIGLVNIHGNVAEMIDIPTKVKGGSWNSYMKDSKLQNSEQWDGKPSPMIGFRLAMNLPEKIDSSMMIQLMSRIPPGTILLTPNFGVDILETRNIDYFNFMNYIRKAYGANSSLYKSILPDKNVWKSYIIDGQDLSEVYFKDKKFLNNPVVGVSYEQAVLYCKWRTEYINNFYDLYHFKYPRSIGVPKRVTYRLPSPEEWDRILNTDSIYDPDKGYIHPDYKLPVKDKDEINKRINKGLTSSVFYFWKNKIGVYAFDDNVSEMTSEPGVARGCNWTGGKENTNCHYEHPENWVGFRCVVDVEY